MAKSRQNRVPSRIPPPDFWPEFGERKTGATECDPFLFDQRQKSLRCAKIIVEANGSLSPVSLGWQASDVGGGANRRRHERPAVAWSRQLEFAGTNACPLKIPKIHKFALKTISMICLFKNSHKKSNKCPQKIMVQILSYVYPGIFMCQTIDFSVKFALSTNFGVPDFEFKIDFRRSSFYIQ